MRRLASLGSLRWRLDRVIYRVAHHVHERVAQLVEDATVDLGLGSGDFEARFLAHLPGQVAHQPLERREDCTGGQQANRHDFLPDGIGDRG